MSDSELPDTAPPGTYSPLLPPARIPEDLEHFVQGIADAVSERIEEGLGHRLDRAIDHWGRDQTRQDRNHDLLRVSHRKLKERVRVSEEAIVELRTLKERFRELEESVAHIVASKER